MSELKIDDLKIELIDNRAFINNSGMSVHCNKNHISISHAISEHLETFHMQITSDCLIFVHIKIGKHSVSAWKEFLNCPVVEYKQ